MSSIDMQIHPAKKHHGREKMFARDWNGEFQDYLNRCREAEKSPISYKEWERKTKRLEFLLNSSVEDDSAEKEIDALSKELQHSK